MPADGLCRCRFVWSASDRNLLSIYAGLVVSERDLPSHGGTGAFTVRKSYPAYYIERRRWLNADTMYTQWQRGCGSRYCQHEGAGFRYYIRYTLALMRFYFHIRIFNN